MAKDTFYFSHDYNARNDSKIKKLLSKHSYEGYGIYWAIIEDLYNNANALPSDYETIAYDLRTNEELIRSIIEDFDLFVIDGDEFGSLSVQTRLNDRDAKSEKARESARKRWDKIKSDANALQPQSDPNAIKESKTKESIVKENKGKDKPSPKTKFSGFNQIKDLFEKFYFDKTGELYYWTGVDAAKVSPLKNKLTAKIKEKNSAKKEVTDQDVIDGFEFLLSIIKDEWILSHLSMAIIDSKFNEITANKNNNGKSTRKNVDPLAGFDAEADELLRRANGNNA